ncbi:MAG: hypothetical protein WAL84_13180 [Candidatus Dormiibacterota bacterium]
MASVASLGREVPFPDLSAPALLVIGYPGRNETSVQLPTIANELS